MMVIGLTGGMGSGKTTVAGFFKDLGVPVYIADLEARRLMNEAPEVRDKITALFGDKAYSNNILDRKYISSQVFMDKQRLEALNGIVHPAVRQDFIHWKENQKAPYVLYEAAILFEQGGDRNCDYVILVTADRETRIARIKKRDQATLEDIEARMTHQWSDEKKLLLADFVIKNEDLNLTAQKVKEIHEKLLETA